MTNPRELAIDRIARAEYSAWKEGYDAVAAEVAGGSQRAPDYDDPHPWGERAVAVEKATRAVDALDDLLAAGERQDDAPAVGYVVGWQESDGRVSIALDESEPNPGGGPDRFTYRDPREARQFLAEVAPEDPETRFAVYALHELPDAPPAAEPASAADRAPVEMVAAPFEMIMRVYLDGVGTGAATALNSVKPGTPDSILQGATQHIVRAAMADPIAMEQLAGMVRRRLHDDIDPEFTNIAVWGGR